MLISSISNAEIIFATIIPKLASKGNLKQQSVTTSHDFREKQRKQWFQTCYGTLKLRLNIKEPILLIETNCFQSEI